MIGIGMVPPALILLCLYVMPESPRWLIARGQDSVARDALTRVRHTHNLEMLYDQLKTWSHVAHLSRMRCQAILSSGETDSYARVTLN